ncbi:CesT family type III secretion system chaperone [Vibrio campbellii]|uniref:CesT family type III secretion system chaperone n=1 Tax=Vibrio campbellii TaxID=680 RepID=UPI00026C474F|nr:CesT family type III secretion system chaperone [Vibrio campbellii]AXB33581.1 CesT family type III secretion system chaperone [Vibrio campbellii]
MTADQTFLNNLLIELGSTWQLNCLELDYSGRCALLTEEGIELAIDMAAGSNNFQFLAELGALPEVQRERHLTRLLEYNFENPVLRQAHYALSPHGDQVLLRYQHPIEGLKLELLANLLGNFITTAIDARNALYLPLNEQAKAPSLLCDAHLLKG